MIEFILKLLTSPIAVIGYIIIIILIVKKLYNRNKS